MRILLGILCWLSAFSVGAQSQKQAGTDGFVKNGEVNIHYKTYGTGKPVLVANGGPGFSSRHMEGFAEMLATRGYQVILFDQRGTGKSVMPKVDSTNLTFDLLLAICSPL